MIFGNAAARWVALVGLAVLVAGCSPSGPGTDEESDPNYWAGINRKKAMDDLGAIEAFERALRNNPESAGSHFELGLLNQKRGEWSTAIYHFERFRRLRPDSNKGDVIRQLVMFCKQELVKEVPVSALNQQMQRELERLLSTNKFLMQEVERLKVELLQRPVVTATNQLETPRRLEAMARQPLSAIPPAERPAEPGGSSLTRTHVVRSGETPYGIARQYGIPLARLLDANPGLEARRLRVGQPLNIPSR